MVKRNAFNDELFKTILRLKNVEECYALFDDLCTAKEVDNMGVRVMSAKLLKKGLTYKTVMEETTVSSATLARISKTLKKGEGYKKYVK